MTLLPEHDEAEALAAVLESGESYSLVKLTPSHLLLLEKLVSRPIAARCFVVGGEALEERHLAFVRAHAPQPASSTSMVRPRRSSAAACRIAARVETRVPFHR